MRSPTLRATLRATLIAMLVIVVGNYAAQVPYYLRLYYFPYHAPPSLFGTVALSVTLAWFLGGWVALWRGGRGLAAGYWLTISFLVVETAFYVFNSIAGQAHGYGPLYDLANPDPVLRVVFAIGYLNMLAGLVFIPALLVWRRSLTTPQRAAEVSAGY